MQVFVRDNNVEQALRVLKKKMQREGIFREMKRRRFYEKPSEQTAQEKTEAVRRSRKLLRHFFFFFFFFFFKNVTPMASQNLEGAAEPVAR